MNFIRTSLYTSISQGFSVIAGLISIKVVSVQIGPQGMAMVGQYLNSTAILSLLATGAIGTGVVKYLSEFNDNKEKQLKVIGTAFRVTFLATLLISLASFLLATFYSRTTFKTPEYSSVYVLWSIFLVFNSFSNLFGSILNGLKQIKLLTIVNVSGTVTGLIITIVLAYNYGIFGVLIAANFTGLVSFIIHLHILNKYRWFKWTEIIQPIEKKTGKLLFGFVIMTLTSGILSPSIQLLVRDRIIEKFSFEEAGYWQSVTRISDYYLSFTTSVLSVYYLPRLSEIKNNIELKYEIKKMFRIVLPAIGFAAFLIWAGRYIIITFLLTPRFLPSAELYGVQFLGDIFKISAWLLAYVLLARALKYQFIIVEVIFSISYVMLCYFLIDQFGLIGATYGFLVNSILISVCMFFFVKFYLK